MEVVERCEVCGGEEFTLLRVEPQKYLFHDEQVWRCECGMVFLNPRLDAKGLDRFYATEFLKHKSYHRIPGERERLAEEHFAALRRELTGERILEIGCGQGWLVRLFREDGRDAEGTEVHPDRRVTADVPVTACDWIPEGHWDAVLAIHVLEHLREPRRFLRELHGITEQIYIEIPAYDLARPHAGYHHSAHLWDFSREHLLRLLDEESWEKRLELRYGRHPKWYGVFSDAQYRLERVKG